MLHIDGALLGIAVSLILFEITLTNHALVALRLSMVWRMPTGSCDSSASAHGGTGANSINALLCTRKKIVRPVNCIDCVDLIPSIASLATKRLQAIFANVLLRRKKDTVGKYLPPLKNFLSPSREQKLNGVPLIALPDKDVRLVKLEFTKEERDIYNMVSTDQILHSTHSEYIHPIRWSQNPKRFSTVSCGREQFSSE